MNILDYIVVCHNRRDLNFPSWDQLYPEDQARLWSMSPHELISRRTATLLARDTGTIDRIIGQQQVSKQEHYVT